MSAGVQAFDFSVDLLQVLLWQYNDAARLQGLLERKQEWYNVEHEGFWGDWVRDVFDLRTANSFGLAVWSVILDIPTSIVATDDPDKPIWGFGQYRENFNNGNFATISATNLTLEQKRLLLRLRYFQLVTRGTVPEVNQFLAYLFEPLGTVWVSDGLAMNARYVFEFPLPSDFELVLTEYDLLPRPAGVKVDFITIEEGESFGFGRYHQPFNQGNFYHG